MRRCAALTSITLLLGSLSACASLVGLDQITESSCAPSCGADSAAGDEAAAADADAGAADGPSPLLADVTDSSQTPADQRSADTWVLDSPADSTANRTDAVEEPTPDVELHDSPADTATVLEAEAGTCGTVYFSESFSDNSRGWTLDTSWSIEPTCPSPPAPQKGNPDPTVDHTTGASGGVAAAFACGNNPAKQTSAARYLTSPAMDVSAAPSVFLTFYRWLNSDAASYMTSTIDVYDGSAWVNVYTNPTGSNLVTDSAWTKQQLDVTAHRSASFRVRFGYAALSTSVYAMSCWNVDDVTVSSAACQ